LQPNRNMTIKTMNATIDISRPLRRNAISGIEDRKFVKKERPLPPEIAGQEWISHEDFWGEMERKLNAHYRGNIKLRY